MYTYTMHSVRAWLVSGTFAAGLSVGMLCGAGSATADTGADSGTGTVSAPTSADSARPDRVVSRVSVPRVRPAAAASLRTLGARVASAKPANQAPKPGDSIPAPDSIAGVPTARVGAAAPGAALPASVTPPPVTGIRRAADRPRPGSGTGPAGPATSAAAIVTPQAAAQPVAVVPSGVPVDLATFAGTYYEQGSVKQFFSIGLVNTKAVYTANPDGTIRVQNSGNYFFNRGPRSSIVGSAVAVNATNTALNVGFSPFRAPSATPPGNYTILANAPDYSWVIVSDPSGASGYILTRSKIIAPGEYRRLLDQARSLGVRGRITPTIQYAP